MSVAVVAKSVVMSSTCKVKINDMSFFVMSSNVGVAFLIHMLLMCIEDDEYEM